jgi:hypothetical protein
MSVVLEIYLTMAISLSSSAHAGAIDSARHGEATETTEEFDVRRRLKQTKRLGSPRALVDLIQHCCAGGQRGLVDFAVIDQVASPRVGGANENKRDTEGDFYEPTFWREERGFSEVRVEL